MYVSNSSIRLFSFFMSSSAIPYVFLDGNGNTKNTTYTDQKPGTATKYRIRAYHITNGKKYTVCVQGDRLHVFVTNRILGQKVSSRVPPSAAVAEVDFLPELDGILKASDALV